MRSDSFWFLLDLCQNFHQQQGDWLPFFSSPLPNEVTGAQLTANKKSITLDQVQEWINKHGGIAGRLNWFGAFGGTNELWQKIARPLLSIGAVGSINTERSAKGLKHEILSVKRNRLSDDQAIVLYRASVNLRHLLKIRLDVNQRVANSLLRHVS